MDTAGLAGTDWHVIALVALIAGALAWALVYMLRQNRRDLVDLEETLETQREEDEARNALKPSNVLEQNL